MNKRVLCRNNSGITLYFVIHQSKRKIMAKVIVIEDNFAYSEYICKLLERGGIQARNHIVILLMIYIKLA